MKQEQKRTATDIGKWLFLIIGSILLLAYAIFWDNGKIGKAAIDFRIMCCFLPLFICISAYHLLFPIILTERGVIQYRFRKVRKQLFWEEIAQIAIIDPHLIPTNANFRSKIVVVPKGCPLYTKDVKGSKYISTFWRQIIVMDYLDANIDFIRPYYNNIEPLATYKLTFKRYK